MDPSVSLCAYISVIAQYVFTVVIMSDENKRNDEPVEQCDADVAFKRHLLTMLPRG